MSARQTEGRLAVIGIGPGSAELLTLDARTELNRARHFFGYKPYLDRLALQEGQTLHASDNREEINRASAALELASKGHEVAMVSGGDPGVFAMAAAVCEAIDKGPDHWRALELVVVPGITAVLAVAARIGAPLGHDFCVLSLSDNLKPFKVIKQRVVACARAGLVLAFYNPISKARPTQLGEVFAVLRETLPPETLVIFGRAAFRTDEKIWVTSLEKADPATADMATCIIVGSRETRAVERSGQGALIYTPRFFEEESK
ncbi:MAG: precorrin-3B C(17)-methyltransferase [Hyphomicrobiaceae bacterium]|nr:precorrin-3B C(17)-methyltransferase [Hyphomicrobiaceae bacterium]